MNNFWTRTITGTLFVVIMVGGIGWSYVSAGMLFTLIIALGLWEFYSLFNTNSGYCINKTAGTIAGLSVFFSFYMYLYFDAEKILFLPLPFIFSCFFIEMFSKKKESIASLSILLSGILYVALPFSLLLFITNTPSDYSPLLIVSFFALVWANDTFAYISGLLLGRHKLFERLSPKKTWEGAIGGTIFTMILAFVLGLYSDALENYQWMILALIISVTATCGDLAESAIKRSLNVKDSGNILPGHGGILDRFDGVLLAAPFAVTYLMFIAKS